MEPRAWTIMAGCGRLGEAVTLPHTWERDRCAFDRKPRTTWQSVNGWYRLDFNYSGSGASQWLQLMLPASSLMCG